MLEIIQFIAKHDDMIITTTYEGPDLDGYSCAVAYAELLRAQGQKAQAAIFGELQLEVQWLLSEFGIGRIGPISPIGLITIALLDTSDLEGLPKCFAPEQVVEIIDHRKLTQLEAFPNTKSQVELVGAAATLVAERFKETGVEPSRESAILLYGGILSNTQNFTHPQVSHRDRNMAAWLKDISQAPNDLAKRMFIAKSDLSGTRLAQALDGDSKVLVIQGKRVATMQLEIYNPDRLIAERREEIESILSTFVKTEGADYGYLNMKNLENETSFILCGNEATRLLFTSLSGMMWDGHLGYSTERTLRKQINTWIDDQLSRT